MLTSRRWIPLAMAGTGLRFLAVLTTVLDYPAAGFPVQGEVLAIPARGVACLALGALLLRLNPLSPLAKLPSWLDDRSAQEEAISSKAC